MNKHELRKNLRALQKGNPVRDAESALMCRHILVSDEYQQASVIGGYMPLSHEADITPVLLDVLKQGKTLVLPLCDEAPNMTLRRVASLSELVHGKYGIPEPDKKAPCIPLKKVDLLFVPLEGIDKNGFRLGKGGGYYDCLLKDTNTAAVGCALSWQLVDNISHDTWDVPLSACVMQDGFHYYFDLIRKDSANELDEKAEDR